MSTYHNIIFTAILGCCLTVTITSNGPVAQHQGDKLGIFKFWQVKENNVEYENKNQRSPRFLHRQNSKNLWTVHIHKNMTSLIVIDREKILPFIYTFILFVFKFR